MKKLIKDLTQNEVNRICKKHLDENYNCIGCPLYDNTTFMLVSCVDVPKRIKKFNEDINKEVDIPDELKED